MIQLFLKKPSKTIGSIEEMCVKKDMIASPYLLHVEVVTRSNAIIPKDNPCLVVCEIKMGEKSKKVFERKNPVSQLNSFESLIVEKANKDEIIRPNKKSNSSIERLGFIDEITFSNIGRINSSLS